MKYYFILGKNPILSQAEILAVFESRGLRIKNSELKGKVYFVEMEDELDIEWLNSRLGGTVKFGKVLGEISKFEEFEEQFFKSIKFGNGKVFFGFSLYSMESEIHLSKYQKKLNAMAMDIKGILREDYKINSRYVVSREPELSSVIVAKNKLLKNGAEICFFIAKDEIIFGQTLAVQEFEQFGERDFSRPGRDQLSGMLPPKLARIMINLAQLKPEAKILDPFCGSGTILQEALVLGYRNLIGTDNSDKAIEDTKKNLEWMANKFETASTDPSTMLRVTVSAVEVLNLDVRDLSRQFKLNSIDTIVTEPYLGPALKGNESRSQIEKTISSLELLYLEAFSEFAKVLGKGGKVVMIFPIYKLKNYQGKIDILSQIEKLGFKKINQENLVYFREKQHVWREILIFKK